MSSVFLLWDLRTYTSQIFAFQGHEGFGSIRASGFQDVRLSVAEADVDGFGRSRKAGDSKLPCNPPHFSSNQPLSELSSGVQLQTMTSPDNLAYPRSCIFLRHASGLRYDPVYTVFVKQKVFTQEDETTTEEVTTRDFNLLGHLGLWAHNSTFLESTTS